MAWMLWLPGSVHGRHTSFPKTRPHDHRREYRKEQTNPNEEAWSDYLKCFEALHDCVDYFVVNVSSPNTPGLRALQEKDSLRKIFFRFTG